MNSIDCDLFGRMSVEAALKFDGAVKLGFHYHTADRKWFVSVEATNVRTEIFNDLPTLRVYLEHELPSRVRLANARFDALRKAQQMEKDAQVYRRFSNGELSQLPEGLK